MAEETSQALPTATITNISRPAASVFPGVDPSEPTLAEMLRQELGETEEPEQGATPQKPAPRKVVAEETEDAEEESETDEESEDEESEDDRDSDEESETDEESEDEDSEEEDADEAEDDAPPGLKGVPNGVVKRLQKQSEQIRELRAQIAQGGIVITPSPLNPLAEIADLPALDEQLERAKMVRAWCRKNPDGGEVKFANGATKEFTADEVAEKLALAEADLDAAPEARERLLTRAAAKPWEQAERICPGMFDKGTAENDFMLATLKKCPEIKLRLPNWEMVVAAMARGIIQHTEESKGIAKWTRVELKGKKAPVKVGKPPEVKPSVKKPAAPSGQRPTVQAKGAKPTVDMQALSDAAAAGDEAAKRKLLRLELGVE